jgi:hypothetical protein
VERKEDELTSDAAEASHELAALLRLVGDDLQGGAKGFVVVGEPLEQCLRLYEFHLDPALWETSMKPLNPRALNQLTSLSVKCDLSFSCSGVKCRTVASVAGEFVLFSTYR